MEFIGDDGIPAKLLKDCVSSISKISKWISYYVEVIKHMRTMYQVCKLVHGDLSEFNILLHKGPAHNFASTDWRANQISLFWTNERRFIYYRCIPICWARSSFCFGLFEIRLQARIEYLSLFLARTFFDRGMSVSGLTRTRYFWDPFTKT